MLDSRSYVPQYSSHTGENGPHAVGGRRGCVIVCLSATASPYNCRRKAYHGTTWTRSCSGDHLDDSFRPFVGTVSENGRNRNSLADITIHTSTQLGIKITWHDRLMVCVIQITLYVEQGQYHGVRAVDTRRHSGEIPRSTALCVSAYLRLTNR